MLPDARAEAAATDMRAAVARLAAREQGEDADAIRAEMATTMKECFGIFRDEPTMRAGLARLLALKERLQRAGLRTSGGAFNLDMMRTVELPGMLDVALATAAGALARTESRGSHARTDYPTRDDEHWLIHTLAHYRADAPEPTLAYTPVTLGMFQPQERKY
jgi:succinate dehydrogenase/fumarate reductase flavoprotein subunit